MLIDVTVPERRVRQEIATQVGEAYTLRERLQMKGIGSQTFRIVKASQQIHDLAGDTHQLRHSNIELRPDGIIVHFRSRAKSLAWVIPYWKLNLYMQDGDLSLYAGQHYMRLEDAHGGKIARTYVARLYELKAASCGQDDDLYGSIP